ncbi:hypothetical protein CIC12_12965 [Burkholderia sp. SG-MS1]|uniref:hypothetical protein n=1 Tax=Paraburkholderia sp. SG-MS1 TaxID=2023741 RepID=UPI001445A5E8|nr:hypothetical protein [Paraburkholderia sp. SG-MS1]NKJ47637.1 hypothetical protein [Paraburkholderia sp. SG-MS1]
MGYADSIRPIRNKMRRFEYSSVLQQISAYLLIDDRTGATRAARMPWIAERLALWTLRDNPRMYGRTRMQQTDLMICMNDAWKSSDTLAALKQANSLDLMIRSLLIAQVPHQTNHGMGDFARQIDLLNHIDPASKLRQVLDEGLSVSAEDYLFLALPFWLRTEECIGDVFTPEFLSELQNVFGAPILKDFLRTIVFKRETVSKEMAAVTDDEWFQPNLMYRYPFVTYNRQRFFWGTPGMRRHFEYAFSDIVVRSDDARARDSFERWFEEYVGRSLRRAADIVLGEQEVRKRFSVIGQCCDFAVITPEAIILLEVKNKALVHTLPATGQAGTYRSKLRATVLKAAMQLDNVEKHVHGQLDGNPLPVHKVTITYGDLFLGSGKFLFDDKDEDDLPHILSIDHLDRLVEAVRLGQCSFDDFFGEFRRRRGIAAERLFSPSQLLDIEPFKLARHPRHLAEMFGRFIYRLTERFGVGPEAAASFQLEI